MQWAINEQLIIEIHFFTGYRAESAGLAQYEVPIDQQVCDTIRLILCKEKNR